MTTQHAPSPLEAQRQQDRLSKRESRRRQREIQSLEPMVEKVIAYEAKARQEEEVVRQFDDPEFSATASEQRTEWFLVRVFFGILVLYVLAEALVMGDVAEGVASALYPLFAEGEEAVTPLWLRRVAAAVIVGIMTAATLAVKVSCAWYQRKLKSQRANLNPGEEVTDAALRSGLWTVFGVKVAYLGLIVLAYSWLYDFSHQRAKSAYEVKQIAASSDQDSWNLDLGSEVNIGAQENAVVPNSNSEEDAQTITLMARGTQMFYVFMVVLHAAILGFPVGNPVQQRPLASLDRAESEKLARLTTEKAAQTSRAIYNRIRTAPEAYRPDLIELCTPIHASINRALGADVFLSTQQQRTPASDASTSPTPASWPDPYADVFGTPPQQT